MKLESVNYRQQLMDDKYYAGTKMTETSGSEVRKMQINDKYGISSCCMNVIVAIHR